MDRITRIRELEDAIAHVTAKAHAFEQTQTEAAAQRAEFTARLKSLRADLSATITSGAKKCADGSSPIGVRTAVTIKGKTKTTFEVGTLGPGPRSVGFTPEQAVEAWNRGEYID